MDESILAYVLIVLIVGIILKIYLDSDAFFN